MYYGVSVWLNGYAYRMVIDGWMFVLPFISVLGIGHDNHKFQNDRRRETKSRREHAA
jgi:hypothetical protein